MLLDTFLAVVGVYHLLAALGSIEMMRSSPRHRDGVHIAGLGFNLVLMLWSAGLLYLICSGP